MIRTWRHLMKHLLKHLLRHLIKHMMRHLIKHLIRHLMKIDSIWRKQFVKIKLIMTYSSKTFFFAFNCARLLRFLIQSIRFIEFSRRRCRRQNIRQNRSIRLFYMYRSTHQNHSTRLIKLNSFLFLFLLFSHSFFFSFLSLVWYSLQAELFQRLKYCVKN